MLDEQAASASTQAGGTGESATSPVPPSNVDIPIEAQVEVLVETFGAPKGTYVRGGLRREPLKRGPTQGSSSSRSTCTEELQLQVSQLQSQLKNFEMYVTTLTQTLATAIPGISLPPPPLPASDPHPSTTSNEMHN